MCKSTFLITFLHLSGLKNEFEKSLLRDHIQHHLEDCCAHQAIAVIEGIIKVLMTKMFYVFETMNYCSQNKLQQIVLSM